MNLGFVVMKLFYCDLRIYLCCTEIDKCLFTILFYSMISSLLGNLFTNSVLIDYLLLNILCCIVYCFDECDLYTLMYLYSVLFKPFFFSSVMYIYMFS